MGSQALLICAITRVLTVRASDASQLSAGSVKVLKFSLCPIAS